MSAGQLIAFAIINLLANCASGQGEEALSQFESPQSAQQANNYEENEQMKDQSLQLMLAKLMPNIWPPNEVQSQSKNHQVQTQTQSHIESFSQPQQMIESPPSNYAQSAEFGAGSWRQPGAYPVSSAAPLQTQTAPASTTATATANPKRQLVSLASNQLFYPPNELHRATQYANPADFEAQSAWTQQQLQLQQLQQLQSAFRPSIGYPTLAQFQQPQQFQAPLRLQLVAQPASPAPQQPSGWLSFLAANRASLASLVQLLPLAAKAFALLPRLSPPPSPRDQLVPHLFGQRGNATSEGSPSSASGGPASLSNTLLAHLLPQITRRLLASLEQTSQQADINERPVNTGFAPEALFGQLIGSLAGLANRRPHELARH